MQHTTSSYPHLYPYQGHALLLTSLLVQLCFCILSLLTTFPAGAQSLLTLSCWRMTFLNRNQLPGELGRQVWGGNNLAASLSELICLACHCSFPVPLVTAGLVLSCVLIRQRVNHTPREVPIFSTDWLCERSEKKPQSLLIFAFENLNFNHFKRPLFCVQKKMKFGSHLVNCSLCYWLWYLLSQPKSFLAYMTSLYVFACCAKYMFGRFVWDTFDPYLSKFFGQRKNRCAFGRMPTR